MKTETGGTKMETEGMMSGKIKLNDIAFRLIAIPACGIAIPILSNMVNPSTFPHEKLKLAMLGTIGIAAIIFHGNKYLHSTLRSYFDWYQKPYHKIFAMILAIPFFTIPVCVVLLVVWYHVFGQHAVDWMAIKQATLLFMLAVIFVVHIYETVFVVKEAESAMVHRVEVDRARIQAELDALKNQIDPHFMFNSLNTLSFLIDKNPQKALAFNDHLAEVYRYILSHKSRDLVMLSEELAFLEDYFALMNIRFPQNLFLSIDIPDSVKEQYVLPPISLQIPAENAIKHNEFSKEQPLHLTLRYHDNETLMFSNSVVYKKQMRPSSGIGLENLNNRYKMITGKEIQFQHTNGIFRVMLPLITV